MARLAREAMAHREIAPVRQQPSLLSCDLPSGAAPAAEAAPLA